MPDTHGRQSVELPLWAQVTLNMNKTLRISMVTVAVVALLLIILHLMLPYLVRNFLNDQLADMGDYQGHVEDVDMTWWNGAYRLNELVITKTDGENQVPFVKLPVTDIKIRMRALWKEGVLIGVVDFHEPELNFVDGESEAQKQTGEGVDWRAQLEEMVPVRLNEVNVHNGAVFFRNFSSDPPVNINASDIQLTVRNLTNAPDAQGQRSASMDGTASFLGHAAVEAAAHFDPLGRVDNLDLQLRMLGLDLTRINDFAAAYGKFDFRAGEGDLTMEIDIDDRQLTGYVKPLMRNVDVFDMDQDIRNEDKGFFRGLWEAIVHGGQEVLQNQRKDQFATRIELSGSLDDAEMSAFQAFIQILRNAFVEAFSTRFEQVLEEDQE
ncbi:protein of unknown function [Halopseudomonas litoralis]|uniref:DUF748 domain-containing protein n=2 Tax=Halopseudomonas litoralis TaxID=797277 RepID=A0A1H1RV79_9GAMM|nr:protein of unknown function [Halopseudomonas litoralis]